MQLYRFAYGRCSPIDTYFYQVYQKKENEFKWWIWNSWILSNQL